MFHGIVAAVLSFALPSAAENATYRAELVFPPHPKHNHAPGIVECKNGDLLVSWYRGSGERNADDVAVYGARLRKGTDAWSEAFVMLDNPGFPDGNTCMTIDKQDRLWLFWPVIIANSWESVITHYRVSSDYLSDRAPKWDWQGPILLKPENLESLLLDGLKNEHSANQTNSWRLDNKYVDKINKLAGDKLYQRLGWQARCKPTVLPGGRTLLPLYSDTYSISIMAISDDGGQTWYASKPIVGLGNIQPAVLRRNDGTLVAYMREAGPRKHVRISESKDNGVTWGPVGIAPMPNPGSGLDGIRLANGHWLLVYNDTTQGRRSLAVSISDDEGKTWTLTRHLEQRPEGSYHYPAVIQGSDATIHAVYSHFTGEGKSMKHAAFNEAWVREGDK